MSFSAGGELPLLTVNGTPATTPSADFQRSLGAQTSVDTPASTPTEQHNLLTTQRSCEMNPYQEIGLTRNGHATTADSSPTSDISTNGGHSPPLQDTPFQSTTVLISQRTVPHQLPPLGTGAPPVPTTPAPAPPLPRQPPRQPPPNPPRV